MTRNEAQTLQTLKNLARHTHPGTVGNCTDWTCEEFLRAVGPKLWVPVMSEAAKNVYPVGVAHKDTDAVPSLGDKVREYVAKKDKKK